jgi:hypothetical protein
MNRLILRMAVVAIVLASPAAGNPDKDKDKDKGKKKDKKGESVTLAVGFNPEQRDFVRVYFVEKHGKGKCPPGLAKKNNGCLPPGQAKKRYSRGHPLPPGIEIRPVPAELEVRIGLPPPGYRYAVVDGDLVKLAVGTLLVVDAIDGLVQ